MNRLTERSGLLRRLLARDIRVLQFIYTKVRCRVLNLIMPYVTHLGSAIFTIFIGLLLTVIGSPVGKEVLLVLAASHLVVRIIKRLANRLRPYRVVKNIEQLQVVPVADYSFPSGHTTASFSLAMSLSFNFPAYSLLFIILASVVGVSRVYLGVHYPSDVLTGAGIGILFAYLIH